MAVRRERSERWAAAGSLRAARVADFECSLSCASDEPGGRSQIAAGQSVLEGRCKAFSVRPDNLSDDRASHGGRHDQVPLAPVGAPAGALLRNLTRARA